MCSLNRVVGDVPLAEGAFASLLAAHDKGPHHKMRAFVVEI